MGVYKNNNGNLELISGATLWADAPIGAIQAFGGSAAPSGWFLCQGQALSRTDYAELFAVIGTNFGSGDGSTTFNLPDLRESVPKGVGLTSKSSNHMDEDGLALGEFLDDRLQAHTHSNKTGSTTAGQVAWTMFATNQLETATEQTNNGVVGRFGATTEVKSVGVNYIIKAQQTALPADLEAGVVEIVSEGEKYSTDEVKTNKTWIDGKPIYRKVVDTGALPTRTYTTTPIDASNVDIYIGCRGFAYRSDNATICINLPHVYSSDSSSVQVSINNNNVRIESPDGNWGAYDKSYVVVEYTKTTD